MSDTETILDRLNRIPPCLVRVLGRKNNGRKPLTNVEIAEKSGLAVSTVQLLSHRKTWEGITIETIVKFSKACGVNHLHLDKYMDYLRRRKMIHIHNGTSRQKMLFKKIFSS